MNFNGMPFAETPENKVQSDPFFPELCIKELTENYGVETTYSSNIEMLIEKLMQAVVFVNDQLSEYHVLHWSENEKLEDVYDAHINNENRLIILYKKAVYSLAKSYLLISKLGETNRDNKIAQQESAADNQKHWQTQCFEAIRAMQGINSTLSVALL